MDSEEESLAKSEFEPIIFNRNYIIGTTNTPVGTLNIFVQVTYTNELNWYIRGIIYPPSEPKQIEIHSLGPIWNIIKSLKKEDLTFQTMQEAEDALIKLASEYNWEYTYDCNSQIN